MSDRADRLAEMVNKTIEEWLAEQGGGMVTGYTMFVNYFDGAGEHSWATAHAERQTPAQTLGILRFHTLVTEKYVNAYLEEGEM